MVLAFLWSLSCAKLGAGMTPGAILADHPRLTREDILAAQAFAADYLSGEEIIYR
jgi:uncharacterized protein (DUF433 family)